MAVVQREVADVVVSALNRAGFRVTLVASSGGFLGAGNVTLLCGLNGGQVQSALDVLKTSIHRRPVDTARETKDIGTAIFIFPVACYVYLGATQTTQAARCDAIEPGTMKLILAIVSQRQSDQLLKTLTDWSYHGTLINTTGGFSHRRNATLMIGVRSERITPILQQIRQVCDQDPQTDSAATIFVLDSDRCERM